MTATVETIPSFISPSGELPPEIIIFGQSAGMKDVRNNIEKVACTGVPMFLRSEGGAGKEIIAKYIHRCYPGGDALFIKVNLILAQGAGLDEALMELRKDARLRASDLNHVACQSECNCTLFFDEVADLNPDWQSKLKQLLQEDQPHGCGDEPHVPIRPRIICASSRSVEQEVEAHRFRRDLFYCINVVSVFLPPLRERREDIPGLVDYFLETYRAKFGRTTPPPSARMRKMLQQHQWPGNIRELENLMKRYVLLGSEEIIASELTAAVARPSAPEPPPNGSISLKKMTRQATRELERKIIFKVLRENHGNRTLAARALNISYRALLYKLKEAGVPPRRPLQPGATTDTIPGRRPERYPNFKEGAQL